MSDNKRLSSKFELVSAILIALVSFATALTVYLTNQSSSAASENNRQGMIAAIKLEAFANENWRKAYQEASSAYSYALAFENVRVLQNSSDEGQQAQAANYEKYLLPNLKQMAEPFTESQNLFKQDGSIDLQARFDQLNSTPEIKELTPSNFFELAEITSAEQRWLLVGSILMAVSLFWLTLSQVITNRRMLTFWTGCFFFLVGILWIIIYLLQKGGVA